MKALLTALFTFFLILIVWAILQKPITESGALLLNDPWGIVTLVDLYIGFLIFILFVHILEKTFWKTALWAIFLLTLGNLVSLAYIVFNYSKILAKLKKA